MCKSTKAKIRLPKSTPTRETQNYCDASGRSTESMTKTEPLLAGSSFVLTLAPLIVTLPLETEKVTCSPISVSTVRPLVMSARVRLWGTTWNWSTRANWAVSASNTFRVSSDRLTNAESDGAKTVKGPGPCNVAVRLDSETARSRISNWREQFRTLIISCVSTLHGSGVGVAVGVGVRVGITVGLGVAVEMTIATGVGVGTVGPAVGVVVSVGIAATLSVGVTGTNKCVPNPKFVNANHPEIASTSTHPIADITIKTNMSA